MKTRLAAPNWRHVSLLLALGAFTACTDASGPGRPSMLSTHTGYRETVIGPPGTNGEWCVRGDLVLDTLPQAH
jgi:hypothetical protein